MNAIDNYQIINPLGNQLKRKFCEIYLAEEVTSGTKCVLKKLRKKSDNQALIDRLKSEATFHYPDSDCLPHTLATFETDKEFVLIRSYSEGTPIAAFVSELTKKQKKEFLQRLPRLFEPILNELAHHQTVHLDIKPSNVLVAHSADNEPYLKLIDFGLSMRIGENPSRETLFPLGYAAPELLLNRLHLINYSTDYFSIGCLIWHLYTGRFPLSHPNPLILTNLQITHPLQEADEINQVQLGLLNQLAAKYHFPLPPNQYKVDAMDESLIVGMNQRPRNFAHFCDEWEASFEKKKWWVF